MRASLLGLRRLAPCMCRFRSLVRTGLAPLYVLASPPCICGPWFCLALCMRRSRSRVCAGTVSLPSYVRVQLQRLRGSRPGCVRSSLPRLRWSRPCVSDRARRDSVEANGRCINHLPGCRQGMILAPLAARLLLPDSRAEPLALGHFGSHLCSVESIVQRSESERACVSE